VINETSAYIWNVPTRIFLDGCGWAEAGGKATSFVCLTAKCSTELYNLTFRWRCIAINSHNKTN